MTQHSIVRGYFESNVEKFDKYYVPSAYLYMNYADTNKGFCAANCTRDSSDSYCANLYGCTPPFCDLHYCEG